MSLITNNSWIGRVSANKKDILAKGSADISSTFSKIGKCSQVPSEPPSSGPPKQRLAGHSRKDDHYTLCSFSLKNRTGTKGPPMSQTVPPPGPFHKKQLKNPASTNPYLSFGIGVGFALSASDYKENHSRPPPRKRSKARSHFCEKRPPPYGNSCRGFRGVPLQEYIWPCSA